MNRLSLRRPRPQAALFLLLAVLPGTAHAQKPVSVTPPVLSSPPAETSPLGQKQMLDGDARLDRSISLDAISVPLNEVLQKESLDKSTDKMEDGKRFLLTAAPDCADLKLQIRLNARPLRTLMRALAQMVPGVWTRTPHGYQLSMTKQAADARSEWWRLFLGEREKALAIQRRAVLAAMETKARRRQADDPETEPSDHAVEEEVADQHDFFHSLPEALKEQIAANMVDSAFYEVEGISFGGDGEQFGTLGWLSQMSPETQEKFKATMQTNVNRLAQLPPALQKYATQAQRGLAAFNPGRVYFLFLNAGVGVMAMPFNAPPGAGGGIELNVPRTEGMPALSLDQTEMADEVYGGRMTGPAWKHWADDLRKKGDAAPTEWKFVIYLVYGMGDAAPPEWKQLAAYQRARIWPNTLPKLPPDDPTTWHPSVSRAGRMDWLGERGHMEYVCDYYSRGGYEMPEEQKKLPVKRPLATELNEIAARHDASWTKDADGVYLVRNNRWYRDDGLEVPEPILRRWFNALLQTRRQEAAAQATVPAIPQSPKERAAAMRRNWDWAAEVFSTLTPWQMRNGLAMFQPEEKDLSVQNDATAANLYEKLKYRIPQTGEVWPPGYNAFVDVTRTPPFRSAANALKTYPHTVHLYGSLDDTGRTALLEGQLPISALSPAQMEEATSLLPFLPQAMQNFPVASMWLRLPYPQRATDRIVFGETPPTKLEMVTPLSPSAP